MKVHQTRMDVIGNNIANVNTIGFKSSRTTFSDMLSQIQRSASAPTDGRGGTNPRQIGLGVDVESIDLVFTDSSPQQTGKNTDLALSGNGLFVLRDGNQSFYTRNGAFMFDEAGYYVMPGNGMRVQGWNATSDGIINTNGTATDIIVPVGKTMEATATTNIDYTGNLNKESLLISKITYVKATGITDEDVFNNVATGTMGNTQSINVDGKNVIAATLTMKDGSTMNVTSGYYEVGRSVPITTLATIYDSLGGRHEVTVLIDKDPTTADAAANAEAQETSTDIAAFYTDDNGIEYRLTANTENVYQYTPTGATAPVYVPESKVTFHTTVGGNDQVVTKNTATIYQANGNYYTANQVTINDAGAYVLKSDPTVTVTQAPAADVAYKYTDANNVTRYVAEANVTFTTDVNGTETPVTQVAAENVAYKYTDVNNATQYVSTNNATTRSVYDSRWRAYLAPEAGKKGPAAGADFNNEITTTEIDGSTVNAVMNDGSTVSYLYFNDRGQFVTNGRDQNAQITFNYGNGNGASENIGVVSFIGLTQYANSTTSFPITNGNAAGILQSLAVDGSGVITGTYTNGLIRSEAQIAVAQFNNAAGLTKVGTTIYAESNNSGAANVKTISDFGLNVISSALEMSNVDLATEFSDMIITQRGFQANSKVATTSDEMLETLVNMKR
ncbi:MAG: flagellar hook-basal body complex protein [Quinella sp. 1Q5]|nr:flagellar hook-basal body complex protein [Quinella sp. 1Q5]